MCGPLKQFYLIKKHFTLGRNQLNLQVAVNSVKPPQERNLTI
jgi:hypothetical protein